MKHFLNYFFKSKLFDKTNNFLARKIFKFFKCFFVETNLRFLPKTNHPLNDSNFYKYNEFLLKKKINNDKIPFISYSHLLDVLGVYSLFKKKISFLDYGAGNLTLYKSFKEKFKNFSYYYYDQLFYQTLVKKIIKKNKLKNLFIFNKKLKYKKFDFVYFGSSIQYLENYKKEISFFFKKAKFIIISQSPFFEHKIKENIIVKQLNLHPTINYLYFINLKLFIKFLKKNNYHLVNKSYNKVIKFINFKNFNKKYKNLRMYDLIFKYNEKK